MRQDIAGAWSARLAGRAFSIVLSVFFANIGSTALAQGSGDEEGNKLVAAAKQEGEIVIIIPPSSTHRDFLAREWPKAFPDIKLSQTSVPPGQQFTRLSVERGAGKYLWDLVFTGSDNAFQLRDAGMLDPIKPEFVSADVKDPATWGGWDDAFADIAATHVFTSRTFLKMPFYNAKLLSPDKVKAESTKIFLDPALKQKVIWDDPAFGGAGTALDQWTSDGGANQQWNIVATSDGYFQITSAANGLAVGVGGSTSAGHSVALGAVTGAADQRWAIQPYNGNYFRVVNKLSGLMLDVTGNSSAAGAAIDQWPGNGGLNQEWTLTAL